MALTMWLLDHRKGVVEDYLSEETRAVVYVRVDNIEVLEE